ncbi:hypothetical protein AB0D46_30920 [Streptomyces sp. NPDC048383]|uniref:hypothetical protein n=1 Tax=Streptomyces sp. NPDC048383 TaxID=3155386 RepID=UPI00343ED252
MGEGKLGVGSVRVGEGQCEGEADLHHRALTGGAVLFGFGTAGLKGGDALADVVPPPCLWRH